MAAALDLPLFDVLAEPNRRRILDLLLEGERPVGDLVAALAVSQPTVSKHLKVLRDAGLVEARTDAQRRVYRLQSEPLQSIDDWLAPYRAQWSAAPRRPRTSSRFDPRLSEDTMRTRRTASNGSATAAGSRFTRSLDARAREGVARAHRDRQLAGVVPRRRSRGEFVEGETLQFGVSEADGPMFTGKVVDRRPAARARVPVGRRHAALRAATRRQRNRAHVHRHVRRVRQGRARRRGLARVSRHARHTLDGTPPPADDVAHWRGLYAEYQEYLGPEASTIGPPAGHAVSES